VDFFIRNKTGASLVFYILFCIISMSLQSTSFTLSIEGVASAFMTPFQKLYWYSQNNVRKIWAGFTDLNTLNEELRLTREKLQSYERTAEDLTEIKSENEKLRRLLNFGDKVGYDNVPAMVISKDPDNWFRTIIINRGSNDGIKINMPVVAFNADEKAVVGKVIEVRGSVSRILPVISSDLKIGVMLQDSRSPGLMQGSSSRPGLAQIDYLSKSVQIPSNVYVVTSGQGGVFPQGLLVGRVSQTVVTKSSAFQRAIVTPIIDYNKVEEVYVIKYVPGQELVELTQKEEQKK